MTHRIEHTKTRNMTHRMKRTKNKKHEKYNETY